MVFSTLKTECEWGKSANQSRARVLKAFFCVQRFDSRENIRMDSFFLLLLLLYVSKATLWVADTKD